MLHGWLSVLQLGLILLAVADNNQREIKLELLLFAGRASCHDQGNIFNSLATAEKTISYITGLMPGVLSASAVSRHYRFINGCNLREGNRGVAILHALTAMRMVANSTQSFTVFIGPPLGGDCKFISDWIVQSDRGEQPIHRVYQVEYICLLESFTRGFVPASPRETPGQNHTALTSASVSMTVFPSTLTRALQMLLRHQGWKRIYILYEVNQMATQFHWLANNMRILFSHTREYAVPLIVTGIGGIQENMNFTYILDEWISNTDGIRSFTDFCLYSFYKLDKFVLAIILLSRPPLAVSFLSDVKVMPVICEGRVAIVQLDPSNVIAYDVLRLWRLELSKMPYLGAAGQSLFIFSALPLGRGYNASSELLKSVSGEI